MLFFTRRWLGAYISFGSVGWLWHSSLYSPDEWGEHAAVNKALSEWNAAVCKGVGICGNAFGDNLRLGEKDKIVEDERPRVPDFVIDHGRLFLL